MCSLYVLWPPADTICGKRHSMLHFILLKVYLEKMNTDVTLCSLYCPDNMRVICRGDFKHSNKGLQNFCIELNDNYDTNSIQNFKYQIMLSECLDMNRFSLSRILPPIHQMSVPQCCIIIFLKVIYKPFTTRMNGDRLCGPCFDNFNRINFSLATS